eukprot:6173870-Alexandrium_andersonii.AAC.1
MPLLAWVCSQLPFRLHGSRLRRLPDHADKARLDRLSDAQLAAINHARLARGLPDFHRSPAQHSFEAVE